MALLSRCYEKIPWTGEQGIFSRRSVKITANNVRDQGNFALHDGPDQSPCGSLKSGSIPHRPLVVHRSIPPSRESAANNEGWAEGHRPEIALVLGKPLEEQE